MNPIAPPSNGDTAMALIVSTHFLPHTSAANPALASAAPVNPPIRACDELDGIPKYHVMMFHVMAPMSPAQMTLGVTTEGTTNPLLTAFATAMPTTNIAMKFPAAAITTAANGERTRVPTMVAIEFAES